MRFMAGIVVVVVTAGSADAASPSVAQQLTGGTSREWVLGQVRTRMGSSACDGSGEIRRFSSDGTVVLERCADKNVERTRHRWTLEAGAAGADPVLRIDGKRYTVFFRDRGKMMVLRERGASQAEPTTDREFRLSED
jgi:hypothetical protein